MVQGQISSTLVDYFACGECPQLLRRMFCLREMHDLFGADLWDEFVIVKKLTVQSLFVCVFEPLGQSIFIRKKMESIQKFATYTTLGPDMSHNRSSEA